MRRIRVAATLAALLLGAPSPAPAVEPNIYIAPEFWHVSLSGDGETGNGSSDRQFNVSNTLGLDTSTTSRSLESFLRFARSSVIFGFSHADFHGSNTLGSDLLYRSTVFLAGTKIHSDMTYNHTKLLYGTPFVDGKVLSAGVRLGFYDYKITSDVKQAGTGNVGEEVSSTVPIIGASLVFNLTPQFRVSGEVLTTSFDKGGIHSRIQEGYAAMDYILFAQAVGLQLGYRYNNLKADDSGSARFDLREKGTFFGVVVRF